MCIRDRLRRIARMTDSERLRNRNQLSGVIFAEAQCGRDLDTSPIASTSNIRFLSPQMNYTPDIVYPTTQSGLTNMSRSSTQIGESIGRPDGLWKKIFIIFVFIILFILFNPSKKWGTIPSPWFESLQCMFECSKYNYSGSKKYLHTMQNSDISQRKERTTKQISLYFNYVWSLICTTTPINNQNPTFDNQNSILCNKCRKRYISVECKSYHTSEASVVSLVWYLHETEIVFCICSTRYFL